MGKIYLIIFLATLILLPLVSSAAGLVPCGSPPRCCESGEKPNGCSDDTSKCEPACEFCHFFVMFKNIVDFILFKIVPPVAILMIAIGGFMLIIAHGGPAEAIEGKKGGPALLSQAKRLFKSVVWGLLIIYGAWIFINAFFQAIGVADWTGLTGGWREGWWQINCP